MQGKHAIGRRRSRRADKKQRIKRDRKTGAATVPARESTRAPLKTRKKASRGPRKFSPDGNGGTINGNGAQGRSARGPVFRYPKSELETAIQRFVDLYDFAPIAYVSFDRVGRIQEANLAATQLLGRSRPTLIGSPFALHVAKENADLFLKHLFRCRSSEARVETELRLKKRNGEKIVAHLSSAPTTSSVRDGALLYQTAIVDLTEWKRAEDAVRRSETRYRTLFDLVPVAVYACNATGEIQEFNRRAAELWGREPNTNGAKDKFCGSYKIYYPDGRFMPLEKCPMARALRGDKLGPEDLEIIVEKPNGERRHVLPAPRILRDERNKIVGAINCLYDITELKRTEKRLAEQARLLDLSNDAILVRDAQERITYWNRGATEIYGYRAEEALGKVTHQLLRTEDPRALARIRQKLERDGRWSGELVHTRKDGTKIVVMSRWSLDRDAEGKPASVLETNTDITARKKTEAALERSKNLLEELVHQRTKALREANTELENEIRRRKGLEGEILAISDREQQRLGQELHDGLCQQLTAISFMARATALRLKNHRVIEVGDIEKLARLISKSVVSTRNIARDLHKEKVDAATFESALRDLVNRQVWKTPCRLVRKSEINLQNDRVASELYRILREALVNANKHARATRIVLEVRRERNELICSVRDNGVGLNPNNGNSRGLGFEIMKYRAGSIGARLKVESPRNGGTYLAVHLPEPR